MKEDNITLPQLRAIEQQDNETVRHIIESVMPEFGAGGSGFAINDPEVKAMYENYTQPGYAYFVIQIQDRVLGGAGIAPVKGLTDKTCELQKMYFLPELRGQGMGQKLIKLCLETAKRLGYKSCYIETMDVMKAAQTLYLKNGFHYISEPMGNTGHFGCNTFLLKEL